MNKLNFPYKVLLAIFGMLIGCLFIFSPNAMIDILFTIIGVLIILMAIPNIIVTTSIGFSETSSKISFVGSILNIILGTLLIFVHNIVVTIVIGLWLIAFPLYNVLTALDRKEALKREIVKIIFGVIVIILGPGNSLSILVQIVGGFILLLSILDLILSIIIFIKETKRNEKKKKDKEVIDVE